MHKAKQLSLQLLVAARLLLGETACCGKKGDESLRTRPGKKKNTRGHNLELSHGLAV